MPSMTDRRKLAYDAWNRLPGVSGLQRKWGAVYGREGELGAGGGIAKVFLYWGVENGVQIFHEHFFFY